jgi:hypothetical protein
MFHEFREALSKVFSIVLYILTKSSSFHLRRSNYYYFKYLYQLNELTDSINPITLESVVKLTCDLNDELKNRVRTLISGFAVADPINFGEVVGNVSLNTIGKIPHAAEYTGEEIIGRNLNPINYNRPIANVVFVESQTTRSRVGNGRSMRPISPRRRVNTTVRVSTPNQPDLLINRQRLGNNTLNTSLNGNNQNVPLTVQANQPVPLTEQVNVNLNVPLNEANQPEPGRVPAIRKPIRPRRRPGRKTISSNEANQPGEAMGSKTKRRLPRRARISRRQFTSGSLSLNDPIASGTRI